ncbi:peptidoglycan DD-metalloendopeptidase family protein [bacterium]|nr:peptidoglycan DD-metalloendopeptidase family protein [bacterium]
MSQGKRVVFVFIAIFIGVVALFIAQTLDDKTITPLPSSPEGEKNLPLKKAVSPPQKEKPIEQASGKENEIESIPAPDEIEQPQEKEKKQEKLQQKESLPITSKEKAPKDGWFYGKILPHKGFGEALMAIPGMQLLAAMEITNAIRFKVDLRILKAGEDFKIRFSKDGLKIDEFIYSPDIVTHYGLKRDKKSGKLLFLETLLPTEKRYRIIKGEITTSLNQALIEREDVTGTIRAVTNNVLECVVNFRRNARKGDTYQILLQDRYYKGKKIPGAAMLYTAYEGRRTGLHEAFKYIDGDDPKSAFSAFYTLDGKALIPNALRLPVDRVHITSPFGWRIHPVTGRKAFHAGVDYGGPTGTPIYAAAKGTVIDVSQDRYSGKKVILSHADRTKTYYLHLSRQLVKVGDSIKPRQQIAKMGRTGRVTGPHLHFGIKSGAGKWLNPLKKHMIATPKLKGKRMKLFSKQAKHIRWRLKHTKEIQLINNLFNEGPQPEGFYKNLPEDF